MPPSSPRRARLLPPEATAFWRKNLEGPSGPDCYLYPLFTKCTPLTFFGNSFSVTLRNFTNFVTILIFLPQVYESLRIMYLLFLAFKGVTESHGLRKNTSFRFPPHYGIIRIAQACFLLISETSRDFIYCATKDAKYLKAANQRLHVIK